MVQNVIKLQDIQHLIFIYISFNPYKYDRLRQPAHTPILILGKVVLFLLMSLYSVFPC